jgi:hypothetical protein
MICENCKNRFNQEQDIYSCENCPYTICEKCMKKQGKKCRKCENGRLSSK